MNESGPIIRPKKTSNGDDIFVDVCSIAPNVWKAQRNGKYWVLKTSKKDDAESEQLLEREYMILNELQHPFIASTFDFITDSPVGTAILMEYVDGTNLRDFIAENPSIKTRKKVLNQILSAVEYLHNKDVLHNDIKPDNILITKVGQDVKIIDFGFSEKSADYLNKRLGGTVGATAPEIMKNWEEIPSKAYSDIYSLGHIIDLLFPKRLAGVKKKCLKVYPKERYQDIASLKRAIKRSYALPKIVIFVLAALLLISIGLTPNLYRHQKEVSESNKLEASLKSVQDNMEIFLKQAADSIANSSIVPYQEFAMIVINHFVSNTYEYKNTLTDTNMLKFYEIIYARMISQLNLLMLELPSYIELYIQGEIPYQEYRYYSDLFQKDQPYSPYTGSL